MDEVVVGEMEVVEEEEEVEGEEEALEMKALQIKLLVRFLLYCVVSLPLVTIY